MSKRKTNVQTITDIMEFSSFGALAQVFVMDALAKAAERVASAPPEAFENWDNQLIAPEMWRGVAEEIRLKLMERGY